MNYPIVLIFHLINHYFWQCEQDIFDTRGVHVGFFIMFCNIISFFKIFSALICDPRDGKLKRKTGGGYKVLSVPGHRGAREAAVGCEDTHHDL